MNLKQLFQANILYIPYSVVQYKRTKFTTRVDNQLLNKPFKLLTISTQNDNALEH